MKRYISLICCIILSLSSIKADKRNHLFFHHFPLEEQLPSNSISRLHNDKEGYIWFGTKEGLCRFDGYRVEVFHSSASNPDLLTNNSVQCIQEDNSNRLWIGTIEGINILNKRNYSITPLDDSLVRYDRINAFCLDRKNNMWVATNPHGIIRFDAQGHSRQILFKPSPESPVAGDATSIYEDRQGRIWGLFWNNGIALYDAKSDTFQPLSLIGSPPFYKTWWAYLLYALLLFVTGYFIYNRIELRNKLKISQIDTVLINSKHDKASDIQLIRRRELNVETFKKSKEIDVSSMQYSPLNEEFLTKSIAMVEAHIEDSAFDFDAFANNMNSSKSTLYRKLKSLTGLAPYEFIRNIRLKHACNLLVTSISPISEIADTVGFTDPKYFSSCFKSEFGMTPREYREKFSTVLN